jgi:S-DNA-T family DNA segregation ATPase FtsK/SpoIIIE
MFFKRQQKKPTKTKAKAQSWTLSRQQSVLLGGFLTFFGAALIISFASYILSWQSDQSLLGTFDKTNPADNYLSHLGNTLGHLFIYNGFGLAAFILAGLFIVSGLYLFFNLATKPLRKFWFWGLYLMIWLSLCFGFIAHSKPMLGGVVGFEISDVLQGYMGATGLGLFLGFTGLIYLVLRLKWTPDNLTQWIKNRPRKIKGAITEANDSIQELTGQHEASYEGFDEQPQTVTFDTDEPAEPVALNDVDRSEGHPDDHEQENNYTDNDPEPEIKKTTAPINSDSDDDVALEIETAKEEVSLSTSEQLVQDFGTFDPTLELKNFKFPSIELLKDYSGGKGITIDEQELEEYKRRIIDTLNNYSIGIASIKATIGPTVTLYEIVPDAGIRISKIKNLEDDIALSLSALGIRIIAPIPGKGTIGIEVPNKSPQMVSMRSVISSPKFQKAEMELPLALGKTISNETFVVDLAKMPHLLMAGATGQGKSVGLNAILASLLYKKHPAEVKFVLVDPKKVELTLFNKIERHYLAKLPDTEEAIITDTTKVIHTLNSLCIEMDQRYDLLKDAMVRNIKEYNDKFKARKLNPHDGHRYLPYIVLVIDEFADLIMTAGKEVETPIARLAQLARAIGIHLIIATQRPSVNVITGIIKANFPARIAFRVTSKIDSRTILDASGADQLIGRGDMLYTQGNDVVRLQCAFLDTPEVADITEFIGGQKAYPDAHLLPEYVGEESGTSLDISIDERDALFRDAAEVLVIAQQGSASLLQRKLKLGYNRAGRIIDQLEAAGIVGPFEGSKARQILVPDLDALNKLLDNEIQD